MQCKGSLDSNTRLTAPVPGGRADYRAVTPFRFPLERIRALRERGEDLAKQELAGALTRRESCADRLRAMGDEIAGAFQAQRASAAAGPASALDLVAHQAYLERMEQIREAGQLDLDRHEAEVDARRDALREAARQRQALERLKDRRRADHERAVARAEGVVLDEIALSQHRRSAS
jgi:flagellar protein FliJ